MSRRSPRQSRIDDRAFSIRVKIAVPLNGLGHVLDDMFAWLQREGGPGNHAQHATEALGGNATALYVRRPKDLVRFLQAFPLLELADGTASPAYTSPTHPARPARPPA